MGRIETFLITTFERAMVGNERAVLEDLDVICEHMYVEDAAACRVGYAVEIAADAHHAFVRDAPFKLEDRAVWDEWQRLERWLLLRKGVVDDALCGRMHTRIGNRVEPVPHLGIEVVEIAERGAEEEVLPDVAERPLDLTLGLGPIWPAGTRLGTRSAAPDRAAHGCR